MKKERKNKQFLQTEETEDTFRIDEQNVYAADPHLKWTINFMYIGALAILQMKCQMNENKTRSPEWMRVEKAKTNPTKNQTPSIIKNTMFVVVVVGPLYVSVKFLLFCV